MSNARAWLVEAQERANLCRCQGDHDQRSLDALVAVLDLHKSIEVWDYDHMNGVWKLNAQGEKVQIATLCAGCLPPDEKQNLEDNEWEPSRDSVYYPCPTVLAITEHLPKEDDRG